MSKTSTRNTKRQKIIEEAARILGKAPNLSMQDLAKKMTVSRATLYRYFPTREALIHDLALEALQATDAAVEGIYDDVTSYQEAFRRTMEAVIPLGTYYHFLAQEGHLYNDPEVMAEVTRQSEQMRTMIDGAKASGELDPSLPTRWVEQHFDALIWVGWSMVHEGYVARREVADLAFKTFWRGVQTQTTP